MYKLDPGVRWASRQGEIWRTEKGRVRPVALVVAVARRLEFRIKVVRRFHSTFQFLAYSRRRQYKLSLPLTELTFIRTWVGIAI